MCLTYTPETAASCQVRRKLPAGKLQVKGQGYSGVTPLMNVCTHEPTLKIPAKTNNN